MTRINQLAQARALARSLTERAGTGRLQVLLVDDVEGRVDASDEPFDAHRPEDVGVPRRELHELAACLDARELAGGLKPTFVLSLLSREQGAVVYFDPSVAVYSSLTRLARSLEEHPIVVSPIGASPIIHDRLRPSALDVLGAGLWESGFVGVSPRGVEFLRWWEQRSRFGSSIAPGAGDRWMNVAAAYFDVWPLDDHGYAVSYLNVLARKLEWKADRYLVDGEPLSFFVFAGFDPRRPWVLSESQGDAPRVLLSQDPVLARLCREYAEALSQAGFETSIGEPYGWSVLPDGTSVTRWIREPVRDAVLAIATGLGFDRPPDPFEAGSLSEFYRWLASPEKANEAAPGIARFFVSIYRARPDVRAEFPEISVADAARFRSWAHQHAPLEHSVPQPVLSAAFDQGLWPRPPELSWVDPSHLRPGFFVTGYLKAELGVGDAARRALRSMRDAGIPCGAFVYEVTKSRQDHVEDIELPANGEFDTNVVWVTADQLYYFMRFVGPEFYAGRYTVGCWAWETENPPASMGEMSRYVDEIWALSNFTASAVRSVTDTPVYVFEPPVGVPTVDLSIDTRRLGIPDEFVYFFMFDYLSTVSRKNPTGVVEAFCRAFRPGEGPVLVLKAINGRHAPLDAERVRLSIGDRPDVVYIDEYLSAAECAAMLARADCYVSLHRSEGFGLTIAEAMALGKPVVATGYSGNLDFMSDDTAFLVPATTSAVGPGAAPYPEDGIWGEPDLDIAAAHMRRVFEAPQEAAQKAALGREVVLTEHGHARAVKFLASRLSQIHELRRSGYESSVEAAVRDAIERRVWVERASPDS